MHQMLAMDVAELMADIEIDRLGIVFESIDDIGQQYDVITIQEACGKSVQRAVATHQIRFRHLVEANSLATLQ